MLLLIPVDLKLRLHSEQLRMPGGTALSTCTTPPNELDVSQHWVRALSSQYAEDRRDAAVVLVGWVCDAYGDEGAALGALVREEGGVEMLLRLWGDSSAEVQEMALLALGNLCSDAVDPDSYLTKAILLSAGAVEQTLLCCLQSEELGICPCGHPPL